MINEILKNTIFLDYRNIFLKLHSYHFPLLFKDFYFIIQVLQSRNIRVKYHSYRELMKGEKQCLRCIFRIPLLHMKKEVLFFHLQGGKEDFMSYINTLKESAQHVKKVSSICGSAMLLALKNIINMFRIKVSNILEIGFSHLVVAVSAMYYGPIMAGICGIVADTLEYIMHPSGPYFPGFAINEFAIGFLYGSFFYKKKITLPRVILARLCVAVLTELMLTPLWLHILYGNAYIALVSARIVTQLIKFPIDCALLYVLLKNIQRIRKQ